MKYYDDDDDDDYSGYDDYCGYGRRYDDRQRYNPNAYEDAWDECSKDIIERLAFYSAPTGTEPTEEMLKRAKEVITISQENNRAKSRPAPRYYQSYRRRF